MIKFFIILTLISSFSFAEYGVSIVPDLKPESVVMINDNFRSLSDGLSEVGLGEYTTDDIPEGTTNLYFTDARVINVVDAVYIRQDGTAGPTADISWDDYKITDLYGVYGDSSTYIDLWDSGYIHYVCDFIHKYTGAVNIGVDDTGHDWKAFGATSGKFALWDESGDDFDVSGDISVHTGDKIFFDGIDGDFYWKYNSTTDYMECYVDGVVRMQM